MKRLFAKNKEDEGSIARRMSNGGAGMTSGQVASQTAGSSTSGLASQQPTGGDQAGIARTTSNLGEKSSQPVNIGASSSGRQDLPGYIAQTVTTSSASRPIAIPSREPILSYDEATSPSSPLRSSSFTSMSYGTEGNRLIRDHFGASLPVQDAVFEEDEEEDDPLSPRIRRLPPAPNLIPLPTSPGRRTLPQSQRPLTPPDSDSSHNGASDLDTDEVGDNLYDRGIEETIDGINTFDLSQLPLDLPPPPDQPPGYSAHLAEDELRLISTIHMDQNHPAAALFTQMTSNLFSPIGPSTNLPAQPRATREEILGGKKCKMIITTPVEHASPNGTGSAFVRLKRKGKIEGRIEIGNVDHVTALEVAIMGYVSTSFYIRGQYTLIDTMPLARRQMHFYPPLGLADGFNRGSMSGAGSSTAVEGNTAETSSSETNQTSTANPPPSASTPTAAQDGASDPVQDDDQPRLVASPKTVIIGKETFLAPNQTFEFSLHMPHSHCRVNGLELPPSAQIFQVGMQAGIEYILRMKMTRKGWRVSEHLGLPIIYEPRAYVAPRRLRALTTNDALNPGWRTIRLNGGKPIKPEGAAEPPQLEGVEVTLLLPSPPVLFIQDFSSPPPIPFHLHFHSSAILPLSSFSDPKECEFVIRFMRVATMLIGAEREVRRMEVPSEVEIWQEGGPHLVLGSHDGDRPRARRSSASGGTSGNSDRRRSFTDRRPSFLKRKTTNPSTGTIAGTDTALGRQISNNPAEAIQEDVRDETPTIVAPLSVGATDVHLLGQLTIKLPQIGPSYNRTIVQSFNTPEVAISYLVEVGLKPKNKAVKEAFNHVWGGGIVEVVLDHRVR